MYKVSIIICTRDRADCLRQTLESFRSAILPRDLHCELLVVDNGSRDHTARVVGECELPGIAVSYLNEIRRGKSFAYNTALTRAAGDVLLFLDDDLRPPSDWIAGMAEPLLSGAAQAVAGGVKIAPHLVRPWMEQLHRVWLASTERLDPIAPTEMIGGNMAFSRAVLERVPGFDTELGPGGLGVGEETLFASQLIEAGYRIAPAMHVAAEHHFSPDRLLRSSFLTTAMMHGRAWAYRDYHWKHYQHPSPRLRLLKRRLRLALRRLEHYRSWRTVEGMPVWEMELLVDINYYRQYLREQRRPRNYEQYGLRKLRSLDQAAPVALRHN